MDQVFRLRGFRQILQVSIALSMLLSTFGCDSRPKVADITFDQKYSQLRGGLHAGMSQDQVDQALKTNFKGKTAKFVDLHVEKLEGSGSDLNLQPISIDNIQFDDTAWPRRLYVQMFFTGTAADSAHKFNVSIGDRVDIVGTISNLEVFSLSGDTTTIYIYIDGGEFVGDTK